jgi:hypothetical protein
MEIRVGFIYISDRSNSNSFIFMTSQFTLEATETLSQTVTQMAVEMINIHLISIDQKR